MVSRNANGRVTQYVVNVQGQRVGKSNDGGASRYIYAGQNQILSELSNGVWTNYLWFGGELVGLARNGQVSYVHTDNLGRPEFATNTGQHTVWKAYNYTYGRSVTQDDIGGLNVGFPGQYYDGETGLWYNGFRDNDATIGRYVQSDPIGLRGGLNSYAYADSNPIGNVDSLGLAPNRLLGYNPALGPIIVKTPTPAIHWAERLVSSAIVGKVSFGSMTVNKFGQAAPKTATFLGKMSFSWSMLLHPTEIACAELDCDKDGIADYVQRDPNICAAPGAGLPSASMYVGVR